MVSDLSSIVDMIEEVLEKVVSEPSLIVNLEELKEKEVDDLVEEEIIDSEAKKRTHRRFIAIVENMRAFIFSFKLVFNRCIWRRRSFF